MQLPHVFKVQLAKKSNMIDYIHMYDADITFYRCPICN
jgi:hypothetical protein